MSISPQDRKLEPKPAAPKQAQFTISDTGRGMTSKQMKKIFLPFFTTKEVGKGTGLGLSISLSMVEARGGRIEVQSMPGAGSSFTVVLPINPEEEAPDERASRGASA